MADIAGTLFTWLHFGETGDVNEADASGLKALLTPETTDLVVISHGWKTDEAGARALYEPLWTHVRQGWPTGRRDLARFVVAGVNWPSKPFRDDFDSPTVSAQGAQSFELNAQPVEDLSAQELEAVFQDFETLAGKPATDALRAQAATLSNDLGDQTNAERFFRAGADALPNFSASDSELADLGRGLTQPPHEMLLALVAPPTAKVDPDLGAAQGLGEALQKVFSGPRAAIARLLNQLSYFEMKARAGMVGEALGRDVLSRLDPPQRVRLHLIGHSFGARLVTAAADAFSPPAHLVLESLTLLQGAFSHNSMAERFKADFLGGDLQGPFRSVPGKVSGPISITHTHNDSACTLAYAMASRLSRDVTESVGDAADLFGSMGGNGAQHLDPNQLAPLPPLNKDAAYAFVRGKVHNVLADACVGSHMDVTNAEVGRFVASALNA